MMVKEEFNESLKTLTLLWQRKDFDGALGIVEKIIRLGSPEMGAEALLFGGMIRQDQGLFDDARRMWIAALEHASERKFLLYMLQHKIGDSYQIEGSIEKALFWYRAAIQTCVTGNEFSCDQTLTALLSILKNQIPRDDEEQIALAIEKSWRVLELPGTPDLTDLPNAVTKLNEGFLKLMIETGGN